MAGWGGQRLQPPSSNGTRHSMLAGDRYTIVALGDSITAGVGDQGHHGYAARLADLLKPFRKDVVLQNLAVSGLHVDELAKQLQQPRTREAVSEAALILFSISGNDLSAALRNNDDDLHFDPTETAPKVRAIVETLRTLNGRAALRVLGLYNPYETRPEGEANVRQTVANWNLMLEAATLPFGDAWLIHIADLFDARDDRLAADHYHPGPRGHAAIAARILSTLPDTEL